MCAEPGAVSAATGSLTITLSGVSEMAAKTSGTSLTAEQLRAALIYDPETGDFTWRYRPDQRKEWNTRFSGKPAGGYRRPNGHMLIAVNYVNYHAHRLAWLYMTGKWPTGEVDHIDTDGGNNVWTNLRDATRRQNGSNTRIRSTNTSGFKGVSKHGERWIATITANNHQRYLGIFDTKEEAYAAYVAAAKRLHGEFARFS
jgi:hypothetical protein